MRVDQFIPAYHRGDAIGDTATHLKKFFLSQGFQSQIYCLSRDSGLELESSLFSSFPQPAASDITILHFALPSPLTKPFINLPTRKLIIYHNITPPQFFIEFDQELARLAHLGRQELKSLISNVSLALADSDYNRQELLDLGFKRAEVFPLFVDFEKYKKPPSPLMYELIRDERLNILFVGRIAPNKKIEDLIKVTFYYKKYISPLVRLIVIGKTSSVPKYYESLIRLADEFYLQPDEISFTGHIADEEMFALYQASDVFLSLSEHEGFCLPLVESMIFDLPIVAYDSTAVPFTLAGGGILIKKKRVDYVAELLAELFHNQSLRKKVITSQRQRLSQFKQMEQGKFLLQTLKSLMK